MPEYRLTHAAEQDLLQIALFGIERFGALRARTYYDRLVRRFEELATHPERYRKVDHIRKGYRRSVCGIHSIYYRIDGDFVDIIRVLGQQDLRGAF